MLLFMKNMDIVRVCYMTGFLRNFVGDEANVVFIFGLHFDFFGTC